MLRILFIAALAAAMTAAASAAPKPSKEPPVDQQVTEERRAEFRKEGFNSCTLTSPEETWAFWDALMDDESKKKVRTTRYGDLILFHHGWGTGIRNYFCLWGGGPLQQWFTTRGVKHPDSMSMVLIRLYWAHLNGCRPDADAFARSPGRDTKFLHCPAEVNLE